MNGCAFVCVWKNDEDDFDFDWTQNGISFNHQHPSIHRAKKMFSRRVKAFLFQVLSIPPVLSSVDSGDGNGGGGRGRSKYRTGME